jgi:hypothetical protein
MALKTFNVRGLKNLQGIIKKLKTSKVYPL